MNKQHLVDHIRSLLHGRINEAEQAIASTRESYASDTKSSAGDKHEVGRAMIQQELDKQEEQRTKLIALQQELAKVPLERKYEQVAFGSLVTTDQGSYFIAIGLGALEVAGGTCFAISLASPIGKALKDLKVGDDARFGDRTIRVLRIS